MWNSCGCCLCELVRGTAYIVFKAAKLHGLSALYVYSTIRAIDGLWPLSLLEWCIQHTSLNKILLPSYCWESVLGNTHQGWIFLFSFCSFLFPVSWKFNSHVHLPDIIIGIVRGFEEVLVEAIITIISLIIFSRSLIQVIWWAHNYSSIWDTEALVLYLFTASWFFVCLVFVLEIVILLHSSQTQVSTPVPSWPCMWIGEMKEPFLICFLIWRISVLSRKVPVCASCASIINSSALFHALKCPGLGDTLFGYPIYNVKWR